MKYFNLILVLIVLLFNIFSKLDAQWLKTGGPYGGTIVSCFAGTGNKLFAGSESRGVFLSADKGETWKSINSDLPDSSIISLLAYNNIIFAGTYDALYVSTNGGENWSVSGKGIPSNTRVYSLAKCDSILLAGTNSAGIFRSSDYGNTWTNVHSGFLNFNTTCFAKNGDKLFAAIDVDGIFVSTDQGLTWNESLLTTSVFQSIFIKNGLIFAGNFVSSDNGHSWERLDSTLNWAIYDFVSTGSTVFAGTLGDGVFASTNSGKTWKPVNEGLIDKNIYALYVIDTVLFASTYKGVFQSEDQGLKWEAVNLRFKDTYISSLITSDEDLFAASDDGIFRSTDDGKSWDALNTGLTTYDVLSIAANNDYLFIGTSEGLFRSSDNGLTWSSINPDLQDKYIKELAVSGTRVFAGNRSSTIYVSENNGTSWASLVSLPITATSRSGITSINVCGSSLYIGTGADGIFHSMDNGSNWIQINNGLTDLSITSITANENILYAGTFNHGVFFSEDNGETWQVLSKEISGSLVHSLALNNNTLFISTNGGVFASNYNDGAWSNISSGLPYYYHPVRSIIVKGSNIFAGTHGAGVWFLSMSNPLINSLTTDKNLASQFYVYQNYPNPFNPKTNFEYRISKFEFVTLKVYDVLGKEVATLVNEEKPAGVYKITFDAGRLVSGVYFYQLNAGGKIQTKKMVLLK